MPSQSVEDYLKVIYRLEKEGQSTTGRIAEALGIAAASVTNMTKRLVKTGLAHHASHKTVHLTTAGYERAVQTIRNHRLLETFLIQIMGYTWDTVHEEAELLEHHISAQFAERMAAMLGEPEYDPHGDPIPSKTGEWPPEFTTTLQEMPVGSSGRIRRVSNEDEALLRYCFERGFVPMTAFQIIAADPFEGPITLHINGNDQIIGRELAGKLFVESRS